MTRTTRRLVAFTGISLLGYCFMLLVSEAYRTGIAEGFATRGAGVLSSLPVDPEPIEGV